MSGTDFALAGQIASRGFERYAEILSGQSEDERRELQDQILDAALDEQAIGDLRQNWVYDRQLACYIQPA